MNIQITILMSATNGKRVSVIVRELKKILKQLETIPNVNNTRTIFQP